MVEQNFFQQSQNIFKLFRIWSSCEGDNKTPLARFLKAMVTVSVVVSICILSISETIEDVRRGNNAIVFSALYLFGLMMASHKLYAVAYADDKICACIRNMEKLSSKFENTSDIDKSLSLYKKLFALTLSAMRLTIVLFCIVPLTAVYDKQLPITPYIPYLDVTKAPNWHLLFLYEFFVVSVLAHNMIAYDVLFCGMMCVCSGLVSSICREIRDFEDIIEDYQALEIKMKETISKISDIAQLTEEISDTFSMTTMSHIIFNSCIMAMGLFMITILQISVAFLLSLVVTILELFQLWIYCYFGQNLVNQRENLQRELYFTRWYDGSKNFKTMLLLTMFESQNERCIYAGKLIPLSFQTFTEVVKKAYTFFTFLRETE